MGANEEAGVMHGGCLCGGVRYEIRGAPEEVLHCHCTMCRHASGAPVLTWAGVQPSRLAITQGEPRSYASSSNVVRKFCPHCGGQLIFQFTDESRLVYFTVGSLDRPESVKPEQHIWTSNRLPWLHMEDGLPENAEEP